MVDKSTMIHLDSVSEHEIEFSLGQPAASSWISGGGFSKNWRDARRRLVVQLEKDASLEEPDRLRDRLEALDRLDAYFLCAPQAAVSSGKFGQEFSRRAKVIRDRLEAANSDFYESMRCQIRSGSGRHELLRLVLPSSAMEGLDSTMHGMSYDYLDELISGVLQLEDPEDGQVTRGAERSFYQPTPARHIFQLIGLTALTAADVFVDLGSGLGHVPMMVAICTEARGVGIESEASYVACARQCARRLNLDRVTFLREDAREADLSTGTVFYLYTPFMGSILRTVLNRLKCEAASRPIRICSYGPCTALVAEESWLAAITATDSNSIAVFCSRV